MARKFDGRLSRRDLLRDALRAGAGIALTTGGAIPPVFAEARKNEDVKAKSVVAEVFNPRWRNEKGQADATVIRAMIEDALKLFTGKTNPADAWRCFASPKERVGVKFNAMSLDFMRTNAVVREVIAQGLQDAGVSRRNIAFVEDYGTAALSGCLEADMRLTGPEIGIHDRKTRLTGFITEQADCVINVPEIKHHYICGVTCALKNMSHSPAIMFGPEYMHSNCCDPYIAVMNALPAIRTKRRISICCAFKGVLDHGPSPKNPSDQWDQSAVMVSTDPVAMDRVALERLRAARGKQGLPDVFKTGARPTYIATAAKMGLGKDRLDEIEVRTKTM
ncbi:MAG TPA: DUF362 domain-containing protein [Candidatus Brocadiia bacterium]|nr:DUF362 domain-containing protein [Candidatus Brocadiia bacterium]